ncbi:MAG: CDP-alcohol phosphatidyltransferase family protein [Candidatus Hadarchaeales archaeon]
MLSKIKDKAAKLIEPFAEALVKRKIRPNILTLIGFIFCVLSAVFFTFHFEIPGGLMLLVGGAFDMMDGAVARSGGMETKFGGVLDSTIDRVSDFLILAAIAYGWRLQTVIFPIWLWCGAALLGSFLVSYIRARAEAAGATNMDVGIAERSERLLIIGLGSLVGLTAYATILVAVLSLLTAAHRLIVAGERLS